MLKELKFLGYLFSILFSILFVLKFYLSETNIKNTIKIYNQYEDGLDKKLNSLPTIKNDTSNIIEYQSEVDEFINNKPKKWWILIK